MTEHPGWLRLKALPASSLPRARNTLTEKLWGQTGTIKIKLGIGRMADGQCASLAFMCGDVFAPVGVTQSIGVRRITWHGGHGLELHGWQVWLRGVYRGSNARLLYSTDGRSYRDTGVAVKLKFGKWKGARVVVFSYGPNGGVADIDFVHYALGAFRSSKAYRQPQHR